VVPRAARRRLAPALLRGADPHPRCLQPDAPRDLRRCRDRLHLEHYRRFFDPLYLAILARTALAALTCTLICLLLGYPVAYAIARAGKWKNLLLFLVVLPFWTSVLVRTFAMIFLLRDTGLVNTLLLSTGIIEKPLTLLYTSGAVMAGWSTPSCLSWCFPSMHRSRSTIAPCSRLPQSLVRGPHAGSCG
jgi:ABC-type sugar transport system permease subunit